MDSFTFKIFVQTGVNLVEVGECDVDHISLITLVHAICEKLTGNSNVPITDYHVWAQIPWSDSKYGVGNDSELLELFSMFEDCGLDKVVFELEDFFYIPTPPEEPQVLDVQGGYKPLGWCDMEAEQLNYEGDSEKDDDGDDEEGDEEGDEDNTQFREVLIVEEGIVGEESVDGDDSITQDCMDGFEGYQSKSDDQYFTDSKLKPEQVRIARIYSNKEAKVKWIAKFEKLVKSNPSIDVKVIGDLLKENHKVSVDMHKLYRAKHRALKELAKEHANCFGYLRRYCARHIYANFKLTYKEISIINPAAKKWLEEIDPQHWSRFAYDHVIRCDHVTNNMTEAFNSMLGTHRAASYLDLLEFIWRMVMRKFNERKEECLGWSSVLPQRVHAKILRHGRESRSLKMIAAGNMEYELLGASGGYVVKLKEYNCQCGSWQVSGIPYCHAMAAISHYYGRAVVKDKVAEFVHSSLTKRHTEHINPPPRTVQPGRPKKQRKRELDEAPKVGRFGTIICKDYNKAGHNKRPCQCRKDNQVFL
ncbi:hypothetical protein EZV62_022597 [Acer yangbiense]|uniref:Zinc finger PMZ-type domain-containing protein n=1 Tax=Acer yangbiense TaxID=1000413 RepID=A0A5C7H8V1_9ROSI|nr:hypothetical protein EZV62_022597 [Acer yangbiense]